MGTKTKRATTTEAHQMLELLNSLGGTIFRQLLWQRASDLDLTYAQSQVLFRLAEHPGSHMGDVAKAAGLASARSDIGLVVGETANEAKIAA